jgi:hypothetical protein
MPECQSFCKNYIFPSVCTPSKLLHRLCAVIGPSYLPCEILFLCFYESICLEYHLSLHALFRYYTPLRHLSWGVYLGPGITFFFSYSPQSLPSPPFDGTFALSICMWQKKPDTISPQESLRSVFMDTVYTFWRPKAWIGGTRSTGSVFSLSLSNTPKGTPLNSKKIYHVPGTG